MNKLKLVGFLLLVIISVTNISCTKKDGSKEGKIKELAKLKNELADIEDKIKKLETEIGDQGGEDLPVPVKIIEVTPDTFNRFINIQGHVESEKLAMISSTMGGKITKINVNEGSFVKRGTVLLEIESDILDKNLAELENTFEFVKKVFQKQSNLWEQKAISELQFLEAKNSKESLELKIETIKRQIKESKLVAPFDGTIDRIFPKIGEMAAPGFSLIQLSGGGNLKIVANVSESYVNTFKVGIPAQVEFLEIGHKINSKISVISKAIDVRNRTFRVELQSGQVPQDVRPNMLCGIIFNDLSVPNSLIVPVSSLQKSDEGYYLYVAEGTTDMVARKRLVNVGNVSDQFALITSGIQPNDKVISEGVLDVAEGQKITIQN
jgi:RND family efflux transporter MFP subunit